MTTQMKKKIGLVVIFVVLIIATYLGYQSYYYVETDNAMVQGRSTLLSSKVSGIIIRSHVDENQKVKAGDLIVEIKPDDYKNAFDEIQAQRNALAAELMGAEKAYRRTLSLFQRGASTQEKLDLTETQYKALQEKLKAEDAQVSQAKLNLEYSQVRAPEDGRVSRKSFEVGMLAASGQPLIGYVAGQERWVVANFKETEMSGIKIGQNASIEVDAMPGIKFEGKVESVSPSTGATFSLLPPDNATGNFTKVVQRVPVRITLLHLTDEQIDRLQAGLSAVVKVKIR